jgi:GNAT superfamily N-acetyltransferase
MPVNIRKVGTQDKKAILEISRYTWGGYDYLPFVIDEWLGDPDSHVYGVEVGTRLAALASIRVVDGGRTGWMEGLRVHRHFRRRRYAHALTRALLEKARDLGVIRLRYTTSTENEASLKLAEKYGFARAFEMSVFWRPVPRTRVAGAARPVPRISTPLEVYAMTEANPDLVPAKVVVFDWKALDCTRESLKLIGKNHTFFVPRKGQDVDSLSYGTLRHRGRTLLWVFTIHATQTAGFLSHLHRNLAIASKHGSTAVMGTYDLKFEKAFQNMDWGPKRHWGTRLVLLEKVLAGNV